MNHAFLDELCSKLEHRYEEKFVILPSLSKSNRYVRLCLMGRWKNEGKPMYEIILDTQSDKMTDQQKMDHIVRPIHKGSNIGIRRVCENVFLDLIGKQLANIRINDMVRISGNIGSLLCFHSVVKIHGPFPDDWDGNNSPYSEVCVYSKNRKLLWVNTYRPTGGSRRWYCNGKPQWDRGLYHSVCNYIEYGQFKQ
jgi:hypothetical protein